MSCSVHRAPQYMRWYHFLFRQFAEDSGDNYSLTLFKDAMNLPFPTAAHCSRAGQFSVRATVAAGLRSYSPDLYNTVLAWRARRRCKRLHGPLAEKVRATLYGDGPIEVLNGPFKGLKFVGESYLGPIIPKWVGTYESQLHPIIQLIIDSRDYRTIINLGATEGYYSVGLAWRLPNAAVYSYDIDASARRTQHWVAHTNGVNNLSIHGRCSHEELARRINERTLVISDIEGSEYELLDPSRCPALARADILLEVHDEPSCRWCLPEPDAEELNVLVEQGRLKMVSRFSSSHCIETIRENEPDPSSCEILSSVLLRSDVQAALSEDRPILMTWLWMKVKSVHSS